MKIKSPILVLIVFSLFSCSREVQVAEPEVDSIQVPSNSVPGLIRIKLKHELVDTKAAGIDLSSLGDYTMTRTFPPAGLCNSPA